MTAKCTIDAEITEMSVNIPLKISNLSKHGVSKAINPCKQTGNLKKLCTDALEARA
jgi:hypothetical protein